MKKILGLLLVFALLAAGCGGGGTDSNNDTPDVQEEVQEETNDDVSDVGGGRIDAIMQAGEIVMFTNAEFPPYEFLEDNEIVGVDVEIGKAIAERLGVELRIENSEFGGIIAAIQAGRGDMAISGITIRDDRLELVDFSTPYVNSIQYIIVPEGSDINYMEDLEGKTAGVQTGTTGAMFVEDEISDGVLTGRNASTSHYNSAPSAMQDLLTGRIDAVVIDEHVAIMIAAEHDGFTAIPFEYQTGQPVREYYGIAIQKGNEDLLVVINEVVEEMVSQGLIEHYIEFFTRG